MEPSDPGTGPFGALVGAERTAMADGPCRFELVVGSAHLNPHGTVHGGVVDSLGDFAMGGALTSRLGPGQVCATLEVKINYLVPVHRGRLRADASVVERTRRIAVPEARVHDAEGAGRRSGHGLLLLHPGPARLSPDRDAPVLSCA